MKLFRKYFFLVYFIGLSLLISYKITPIFGIIDYGDGAYFPLDGNYNFLSTWRESEFGVALIAQVFTSFLYIPSTLVSLIPIIGEIPEYHSYILFVFPISLCAIIGYFLGKNIAKSKQFGYFSGTFIFSFNCN